MTRLNRIYDDLANQQRFHTLRGESPSETVFRLTKNTTKRVRKISRKMSKHYKNKRNQKLERCSKMNTAYADVCMECGMIEKHCQCTLEPYDNVQGIEDDFEMLSLEDEFEIQSGTTNDVNISKVSNTADYENVQFADQHDPYIYDLDSTVDPTRRLQDTDDATLEHFFSRPIKIHEAEWATNAAIGFDIDPWSLYWTNPRVANRIVNYNLLRCNLKIKIVINGNTFQYGRAIASYLPFQTFDLLSVNSPLIAGDLVGLSQLPHIFLDPTTSVGGEMKLPMFNYQNYVEVPESQWDELGLLYVRSINDLKHANGAVDRATISIFAWAEDVAMSVLTSVESTTLIPQSGKVKDDFEPQSGEIEQANKTGMISGPATTIAKWASYLTKVPYVGPFAIATEIAANATSKIAKIFGYSRPPVTKNPEPYRPTPMSSLALTNVPDTTQKLTLDNKQELTIDPRISGLGGVDPLNIREIAKRESYLTTFTWAIGTTPETLLWNSRVDPVTWVETGGTPTAFHFPACAFAALPFQHWTGTMKFRFQIVGSGNHRGRLKIVYDPLFLASNEYNTNYLRVIDIADERDFTIECGMGQERTLLNHHYPGVDSVTQMYSTTPYASREAGNGVLGVYVVNELTNINSTTNNDIEINVFVSMGDDFEVFVPEDHFQKFVFRPQSGTVDDNFEPQSSDATAQGDQAMESSAPQHSSAITVGMGDSANPDINKVYTGEAIASFRTLLKRYNLWSALPSASATDEIHYGRMPHFPYLRGSVPGAVDFTSAGDPYNYCNTVLLHWVRNAFQGWRGSIRYKLIPRGAQTTNDRIDIQRSPWKVAASEYIAGSLPRPTYATTSEARASTVMESNSNGIVSPGKPFSGVDGQTMTLGSINPVMEFEMPFYSAYRFEPGKAVSYTGTQFISAAWDYRLELRGDQSTVYDVHVAGGEDLQFYFFSGLPRMYYEPTIPAPQTVVP